MIEKPKPSYCVRERIFIYAWLFFFFFSRENVTWRDFPWKQTKLGVESWMREIHGRRSEYLRDRMAMWLERTWKKKLAPWRNTTTPVHPRRKNSTIISVRLRVFPGGRGVWIEEEGWGNRIPESREERKTFLAGS